MITFEEAKALAKKSVEILGTERISFENSLFKILAENIDAQEFFPPFDKSAMDGYACRGEDLANVLEVLEVVPAGKKPQKSIGENQCVKIMTGAMIPKGADTVIIVENVTRIDENHIKYNGLHSAANICYKGEDAEKGEIIILKGSRIDARHITVLATLGVINPLVYIEPKIGVFVTGSELVEPHKKPKTAQIRNSNAYSILSQLKEHRFSAAYYGIVPDDYKKTETIFNKALKSNDVLLMSGAVSMGDFDFIPQLLKDQGFEIIFHGIDMKPGKRMLFAKKDKKWIIGLPGNPVSTFVQMHEFVLPFLYQLQGREDQKIDIFLPLDIDFERKKGDKKEFVPCIINQKNKLVKVSYNGSAHINALTSADGLFEIPIGTVNVPKNTTVKFIPFLHL